MKTVPCVDILYMIGVGGAYYCVWQMEFVLACRCLSVLEHMTVQ